MDKYYIYLLRGVKFIYMRTTGTLESAEEWCAKWRKRGKQAVWTLNETIPGAYY